MERGGRRVDACLVGVVCCCGRRRRLFRRVVRFCLFLLLLLFVSLCSILSCECSLDPLQLKHVCDVDACGEEEEHRGEFEAHA